MRRQGRAGASSSPPSYTVATFRCETFQLLFPFRESLLLSPRTRSPRRRPHGQCACARANAGARRSGPRAASASRRSITWLAGRRRRGVGRRELGGGSPRVVETSEWEKSQPLCAAPSRSPSLSRSHTHSASRPARVLEPVGPCGRSGLRRGGGAPGVPSPSGRVDGRRAGCGAWCPRSWAACPAR